MLIQKTAHGGGRPCCECGKDTEYLLFFGEHNQSGFIPVCGSCLIHTAVHMLQIGLGIPPNEYQVIDTSDPGMFTAPVNIGIGSGGPIQYMPEAKTSQPFWRNEGVKTYLEELLEFQDKKEDISMEEINSQTGVSALKFMNLTASDDGNEYLLRPRALCGDGFSISIQGGNRFSYCQPRALCRIFESVELGFPNQIEDLIMQYIDGPESNPLGSVYGFVPIEVVDEMIAKHGGIVDIDIGAITALKTSHSAYYEECRKAVRRELVKPKEIGRYE